MTYKRTLIKQGGSYLVSLPMKWIKSMNLEMKYVIIEIDSENKLRITPIPEARQDSTGTRSLTLPTKKEVLA